MGLDAGAVECRIRSGGWAVTDQDGQISQKLVCGVVES